MSDHTGEKPLGLFSGLYRGLITPDRSFSREDQFTVSRFLLFLLIVVLVLAGSALTQKFFQNGSDLVWLHL